MIALLDYGAGNVGSVLKAVRYLGFPAQPVSSPELLAGAEKIILPGQGHFGAMMKALAERRLLVTLRKKIAAGTPYLGICLGLQALYESSEEAPGIAGLGLLRGKVRRFQTLPKVPQVGWNQLQLRAHGGLFKDVAEGSFVYYCHSYYGPVIPESVAVTEYGETYAAGVEKGNVWAVQFHPEKSGEVGLRALRNFLEI
ncbi:MAG: imidazole glycerol phosphate synthase subunit HisH [Acidobacteriia bacterium]|nr:imidazole glycerol phosphate synthase subunit HisH [Terriglobia bacterium]